MILDYHPSTKAFTLQVPRQRGVDIQVLMREHGLDLSMPRSTAAEAMLFTREPYAAVTFFEHATPGAKAVLAPLKAQVDLSWANDGPAVACPADQELWPYQRGSIAYAMARQHVLIGDQPGLGKTPIAICLCNERQAERILVICPASIRLQWVAKIRQWSTMRYPMTIHTIMNGRHGVHPKAQWTVVSYDLARTEAIGKALAREKYDVLILDEAHYLKTSDSRRTRAIFGGGDHPLFTPIAERSASVVALTGTPLPNRPREAYTIARALCFDAIDWVSEDRFKERFNPSLTVERTNPLTGKTSFFIDERSGRHAELQNRLRANFMVRHLKREVLTQLKLPRYDLIQVEETGPVKQALQAESLLEIDPDQMEGADATILGHIAVARRLMGVAIAPQVADYVDMLVDGGEDKIVLFGWHIEVLDILQHRLQKHGLVRIDGGTSATARQNAVTQFRLNKKVQIILGNTQAMGIGVDGLQEVSCHALIAEPDWTPGNNIQAFDRLDRAGQARAVQGDIFVAPGSIAEKVLASALRKLQTTHKALDMRQGGK